MLQSEDASHQQATDIVVQERTCDLGNLSRCDGSAQLNQGDTSILAAVYGPGEVKMNKEIIDRATVEVTYKPKIGLPSCKEKFQERIIRNTCETVILASLHPRTAVDITIQEMQNSGSILACSINAACLALMDAAVSMKYLVAAVTCVVDLDGKIMFGPTKQQEDESIACMTFAFDSKEYNVITILTSGSYSNEQFQECLAACREASKGVFEFYRNTINRKLSKE